MTTATDLAVPGIAAWARGEIPDPPTDDDGNAWTHGKCWLYCQKDTGVMWIGPAMVAGVHAAMYACATCIGRLHDLVWESKYLADRSARPAISTTPAESPVEPTADRARSGQHRARSRRFRLR